MMIDTMSISEAAKITGTSRQNIHLHITRGNINAQRGIEHKTEWRLTPESLTELAQNNYNGLIANIGIFLFSHVLHSTGLITDERYSVIKDEFKQVINVAKSVDALQPVIERMIQEYPFMREVIEDNEG